MQVSVSKTIAQNPGCKITWRAECSKETGKPWRVRLWRKEITETVWSQFSGSEQEIRADLRDSLQNYGTRVPVRPMNAFIDAVCEAMFQAYCAAHRAAA